MVSTYTIQFDWDRKEAIWVLALRVMSFFMLLIS